MTTKHNHSEDRDPAWWSRRAWAKSAAMLAALVAGPNELRGLVTRERPHRRTQLAATPDTGAFNVRDFGARGDGRSDDRSACQKALDAAANAGGTVTFPRGVYKLEAGGLSVESNVAVSGSGTICA